MMSRTIRPRTFAPDAGVQRIPARDATASAGFRADAARELRNYGVAITHTSVVDVAAAEHRLAITLDDGHEIDAAAMLPTTRVHDELPGIIGLAERWGSPWGHAARSHDAPAATSMTRGT